MSTDKDNTTLPNGFNDLMYVAAQKQLYARRSILDTLNFFSYQYVEPSLVDNPSTFENETDNELIRQAMKIISGDDQSVLYLRPDITPQISRLAKEIANQQKLPIRVSYSGDVVRTKASGISARKQQKQLGAEVIYGKTNDQQKILNKELEIIVISLLCLQEICLGRLVLDIQFPSIAETILNDNLDKNEIEQARNILSERNLSKAKKSTNPKLLQSLIRSCGDFDSALKNIKPLNKDGSLDQALEQLENINNYVANNFDNVDLTIDFIETRNFTYHQGKSFSIFDKATNSEIAKGGSYSNDFLDKNSLQACGFSIYVNNLEGLDLKNKQLSNSSIESIDNNTSLKTLSELRTKGSKVAFKD